MLNTTIYRITNQVVVVVMLLTLSCSFTSLHVHAYIYSQPAPSSNDWNKEKLQQHRSSPPSNVVNVDDIFRQEYQSWAKRYGKQIDDDDETKFENFKLNFMLQMQQNEKTGVFYLLNEYGDMSAKEYQVHIKQSKMNHRGAVEFTKSGEDQNEGRDATTSRSPTSSPPGSRRRRRSDDPLTGVEVMEALAKTAQEYQEFLMRSGTNIQRRRASSHPNHMASDGPPKPRPSPETGQQRFENRSVAKNDKISNEEEYHDFLDGITSRTKVDTPPVEKLEKVTRSVEGESKGVSVIAELVVDPPPNEKGQDVKKVEATTPRVKPPKANSIGQYGEERNNDGRNPGPATRPGSLESKSFTKVAGYTARKDFFTGFGTQVIGISTKRRLVRWTPDMPY